MATLVFVESAEGKIKKTSLEAVAYAQQMGQPVTAIALGDVEKSELENLGKYGVSIFNYGEDELLEEIKHA